jgi:hypothetical protein
MRTSTTAKRTEPAGECYACGRRLRPGPPREVYLEDDDHRAVFVGPDWFRKVHSAPADGYPPPRGGPRLFATAELARAYAYKFALLPTTVEEH